MDAQALNWFQVHEDGARDIALGAGLVEVHVDAVELRACGALIRSALVDAMLRAHGLPEAGADLYGKQIKEGLEMSTWKDPDCSQEWRPAMASSLAASSSQRNKGRAGVQHIQSRRG